MKRSQEDGPFEAGWSLNTVALQNAVLCAECDVVSDSPHDRCLVCGSRSLFNIARMFGGNLPRVRARVIDKQPRDRKPREIVLSFPEPDRPIGRCELPDRSDPQGPIRGAVSRLRTSGQGAKVG
jgi:hypothetical protein